MNTNDSVIKSVRIRRDDDDATKFPGSRLPEGSAVLTAYNRYTIIGTFDVHKVFELPKVKVPVSDDEKQKAPKSNGASSDDGKQEEPKSNGASSDDEKQEEPKLNSVASKDEKEDEPKSNDAANDDTKQETEDDKYSRNAADKQLEDSLEGTVQRMKPDVTWDKVAGLQNAKCQLQIAAELPRKQPSLFTGNRKAPQFILLYGPPGTGKGHLAKALCNSVDSTLLIVSASDMTSKWHSESER